MFPIVLTPQHTKIILIGDGPLADNRAAQFIEAGHSIRHYKKSTPGEGQLKEAHIVYIVDHPHEEAIKIAQTCRAHATLVNIEDDIPNCDFHTPALVRRGDLLISISTNGKSPALGIRIKKTIAGLFPEDWAEKLDTIAKMRLQWRSDGASLKEVRKKSDAFIDKEKWFEDLEGINSANRGTQSTE